MNLSTAKRLCKLWQKRLSLLEWTIELRFVSAEELRQDYNGAADDEFNGDCEWYPETTEATIRLNEELEDVRVLEETIAHELLHLRFEGHLDQKQAKLHSVHIERAMNHTAKALVAGYRGKTS